MPVGAAIGAVGALGSAGIGYMGSRQASQDAQRQATNALNAQQGFFDQGMAGVSPFIKSAQSLLPTLQGLLTPGPNQTDILSKLPGFQFAQDWGQKAVQNIGTTTGLGGNVLKAGADYATGVAQQGFGGLVNMLQNFTNTGANAASSAFGQATQTGSNIANTFTGLGQAQGAGALGAANALSGGFSGATNAFALPAFLNALRNQGGQGAGVYGGSSNSSFSPPS